MMSSAVVVDDLDAPAVLIVDDDVRNLLALEAVLEPLSCRLVRCTSGEEALRHVLREEFAVILVDGQVRFAVADTGRGIRAEELPFVFDRFWQAKDTARAGTGLGLAICQGIIRQHGGEIWVESAAGAGTTFFFTLPRVS